MRELVAKILVDPERTDNFFCILRRISENGLETRIAEPLVRIVQKRIGNAINPRDELRISYFDLRPAFLELGEQPGCRQVVAGARQLFTDRLALARVHCAVQLSA
ncbi:hypothetical protein [Methylosinus sp. KRF6]|uniref:hypothetical protein n=1 Tax=Methylosinus sp. KRF6 TaxID=2846853 RepID=UPI001C0E070B|nr:hypothetical protein [Methylosinus sp. KRF6]MBU3888027.1 hypothetical protein [Methylosinus sp. KRF6]